MKTPSEFSSSSPVFHAENVPAELTSLPQFVCWHYQERNRKRTKPPVDAKSNGKLLPAKTNDPSTWASFDVAVATAQRLNLPGIGLALSEQDGLTGLDLDHVFNPATGEIDPLAIEVLTRFQGTYTEISPGGDGFRIFCYGKALRSGKVKGTRKWLEEYTYPSSRYLTVTGNHWTGSADTVTPQQDALNWLHSRFMDSTGEEEIPHSLPVESPHLDDAALISKASKACNGGAFDALWHGDTSAHGGDHSAADMALLNLLAFWTDRDATRIDRLFRQSGLMREKWDEQHGEQTYGHASIAKAIADCRDGYSGKRPATAKPTTAKPAKKSDVGTTEPAAVEQDAYRGTDEANAALFLELHRVNIRYCPPWDKWMLWTGTHWRIDEHLEINRLASDLPKELYRRAADAASRNQRADIAELAHKLESVNRQTALLSAARCRVVVHHTDLNKGHFLLNASNGTIDLHTGTLRPHERRDLLTHDVEIPYQAISIAPTWLAFLDSIFAGDDELMAFIQRAVGYSLTGDVREQVLFIVTGVGSNGKSVFLNVIRKLLGSLAIQAAPDLLMVNKSERHPTDQADLFAKRLVVCQETGEGRRFNETLVKQLTGGDGIRARRMREDFWEFNPTHKLWLSTNHKPEIRGTDHAIWRRIRLIPFNVKFTDDGPVRKNPQMEERLTAELPGILAWAVQGCLDWQRQGLNPPAVVTAATASYQLDMDILAAWMNDCCVVEKHCETKAADLYASYCAWCEQSGEFAEKQRKFGMRLKERGFINFGSTGNVTKWRGIGLLNEKTS